MTKVKISNIEVQSYSTHFEDGSLKFNNCALFPILVRTPLWAWPFPLSQKESFCEPHTDQTPEQGRLSTSRHPQPGQAQSTACLSDSRGTQTYTPEPQLSAAASSSMGLKQNSPHQS